MNNCLRILIFILVFCLVACSSGNKTKNDSDTVSYSDSNTQDSETTDNDSDIQDSEIVDDSEEMPDHNEDQNNVPDADSDEYPDAHLPD